MTIITHDVPQAHTRAPGMLSYLEQPGESESLVVLVHGLGQDGNDYRAYLAANPGQHGVAITLPGFEPDPSTPVPAISLDAQARTLGTFIREVAADNRDKELVVVGFSLGADIVLRLAELCRGSGQSGQCTPRPAAVLLLDPNVNQSTMLISRLFARADPADPLPAFKELINLAPDLGWLRDLCAYLIKIQPKDFAPLKQLSLDMLDYWKPDGYQQIGARLAAVSGFAERVRVVLSASYDEHLAAVRESALAHGARGITFELTELRHFDLIRDQVLTRELHLARQGGGKRQPGGIEG